MATRSDFYLGRDPASMRWLGSLRRAGEVSPTADATSDHIMSVLRARVANAKQSHEYQLAVHQLIHMANQDFPVWDSELEGYNWHPCEDFGVHGTEPWPWQWSDSSNTDLAYAFDEGQVWASSMGGAWTLVVNKPDYTAEPKAQFPTFTPIVVDGDDDDE